MIRPLFGREEGYTNPAADKNVSAETSVDGMVIGANKSYGNFCGTGRSTI